MSRDDRNEDKSAAMPPPNLLAGYRPDIFYKKHSISNVPQFSAEFGAKTNDEGVLGTIVYWPVLHHCMAQFRLKFHLSSVTYGSLKAMRFTKLN